MNETWQGRTKPKLMVRDICYRDQGIPGSPELLAELGRCEDGCLAQGALGAGPADAGEHGPYAAESRAALSALAPEELTFELVRRLIGERSLLPAQARALELLGRGRSSSTSTRRARPSCTAARASSSTRCAPSWPTRPTTLPRSSRTWA